MIDPAFLERYGRWVRHYEDNPDDVGADEWRAFMDADFRFMRALSKLHLAVTQHNSGVAPLAALAAPDRAVTDARNAANVALAAWVDVRHRAVPPFNTGDRVVVLGIQPRTVTRCELVDGRWFVWGVRDGETDERCAAADNCTLATGGVQ